MTPVINQCRNRSPEPMPRQTKRETAMEMLLPEVLTRQPHVHRRETLKADTLEYGHPRTALPPAANHLLARLPAEDYQRLAPHLEPVDLPLGWAIHEVGDRLKHAYFPTESIFSRLNDTADGASVEVAVTGNEGLAGVSLYMGAEHTTCRAVVQSAGRAYRLPADFMMEEFGRGGHFQRVLLRYTQALMTQVAQTAMCYRHHSIEQQFCCLLLKFLDRLRGNEILMTQEMIANMMGVRREGITAAAGHLQSAGPIIYRRGHITVLDRPALEQRVCECYAAGKKEFDCLR